MRTRQTMRKTINLPGHYLADLGEPRDVVLRDLSVGGCRFDCGGRRFALGAPIQIFVAGTGPHRAIVKWVSDGEVGIGFQAPLSEAQFDAFQASHVPDPVIAARRMVFDDISDMKPQRFC
ncbi:PilZ domain-containing protein [Erythrobacter sp.]|jgi:hypothetical protein|uniref:PilZ domain-containing protein n=1 Tax=Erythrobacter sp. TaxID=1042 RepID=UPI002EA62D7D|nr:PilZ domain-containing protein [Erythrobacter sp.]